MMRGIIARELLGGNIDKNQDKLLANTRVIYSAAIRSSVVKYDTAIIPETSRMTASVII